MELTIQRLRLVEITDQSIIDAGGEEALGVQTVAELIKIAATTDRILMGAWWSVKEDCGCLIGTLLGERVYRVLGHDGDDRTSAERALEACGLDFDIRLRNAVSHPYSPLDKSNVVTVTS